MNKVIALILVGLCVSGCTQPDRAHRVLADQGYTEIKLHGYDWWNCSEEDTYKDKFTAKSPTGKDVSGVVCAGLFFKGSTIRFD